MAKILLVEDDNNLREIYEARLQAEGYDIVSAKDGEEALVIAKKEQPDLIIADVMMPRVSGFEMLDILRNTQELKDVHVIMLTALGQAEDKTRADSLGADRYLVKSQVTLEDIVKTAADVLAGAPAGVSLPAAPPADAATSIPQQPAPTDNTPMPTATSIPVAEPPAVTAPAAMPTSDTPTTSDAVTQTDQTAVAPAPTPQPTSTIPVAPTPQDNTTIPAAPVTPPPAAPIEPPQIASLPTNPAPDSTPGSSTDDTQLVTEAVKSLVAETDKNELAEKTSATPEPTPPATPPQDDTMPPAATIPTPSAQPSPNTPLTMEPVVTAPPAPAPAVEPPPAAVTIPAVSTPAPPAEDAAPNGSEDDISVTGRKTIQPLPPNSTTPPAGLDELLAREGHNIDTMNTVAPHPLGHSEPPHPPGHVISPGNTTPAGPGDPNSISL